MYVIDSAYGCFTLNEPKLYASLFLVIEIVNAQTIKTLANSLSVIPLTASAKVKLIYIDRKRTARSQRILISESSLNFKQNTEPKILYI